MKEKKIKILWSLVMVISLLVWGNGTGYAKVMGRCDNCHTMHNSQGGAVMATYGTQLDSDTGPFNVLLRGNCLGCHGQDATNATGYVEFSSGQKVPQVYKAVGAVQLAGGNFKYVDDAGGDAKVHNVKFLANPEGTAALFPPPGDEFSQTGITSTTFTCAGQYGCHGDRTAADSYAAISGAHHGNTTTVLDSEAVPSTPATSFRWLLGVKGWENDAGATPWQNATAIVHNEYWGVDAAGEATISTPGTSGTISGLCAECHGDFHGTVDIGGATSPFTRHPADIVLSSGGEYASYTTYSIEAPVARAAIATINISGTNDKVTPAGATDIVMCLSCHYAHGGPHTDLLRWDYSGMIAGTSTGQATGGCFTCHTTKDD